ncbi:MAG: glutathione S-transferase [Phenylobacterium sp. RIFCSPHIGHO2_01_FULL_69_31]|uniref:glutathione S-transferase family protein n=1 Tax=Phenylobacterium sp. RIFCSPHIGHO2_01_FULL_69_31 TaxID=1801944 RepID=UPI0008D8A0B3|nr:glutathione S-transferase family protein [Phenylobacterium sp. RIFCSPHIGHO2_01_FULL_69_31]OHB26947.1 MAG: glutathione S-transferase [Phenylobacterium sp. RIFCSPHIGHO2_01_FULL_69_31]
MKVIGSYVSPYVRKVLACLALKGLTYEIDPITPFFGDDDFSRMSPLRRIPVLLDGDLQLCDSSVICAYLDEAYPGHPLLPADPRARARARWLEEFADTRMGDVFIWGLFYPLFAHPAVWNEPGDQARVDKTLAEDAPAVLNYLEGEVPVEGFLFGTIGLADIALGAFFRNAGFVGFAIDDRWPLTAAYVARVLAHPALADLRRFEDAQIAATPAGRRAALAAVGAPLSAETVATPTPRKGIMSL